MQLTACRTSRTHDNRKQLTACRTSRKHDNIIQLTACRNEYKTLLRNKNYSYDKSKTIKLERDRLNTHTNVGTYSRAQELKSKT